ncbi:hypothetical protein DSBG_0023 [Desulfosporosinus sp. BG]|nr:hypothetical protein DSBG_0023 [Desulfosporosinus sp. BG]
MYKKYYTLLKKSGKILLYKQKLYTWQENEEDKYGLFKTE